MFEHEAAQRAGHTNLGPAVTECFARDGAVCLRGLFDRKWVETLREAVEVVINNPGPGRKSKPGSSYIVENSLWRHHEVFNRFIQESPVAEAAATVMGSKEVRLYNDSLFVKEPGASELTPWHHDLPYFRINGEKTCSIWMGLDPVKVETGALRFVRGSHLWGKMFRPVSFTGLDTGDDVFDGVVPDIDADPERYPTIGWDLEPGDVTFHHLLTLHSAKPNSSLVNRRRAHTVRFTGDGVTWINRPYSTAEFDVDLKDGDLLEGACLPKVWPKGGV